MWRSCGVAAIFLGQLGVGTPTSAADLTIHLSNTSGSALVDAVVFAAGANATPSPLSGRKRETIVQHDRVFVPFVTVVEKGTAISFPNDDPMLHHVYSFSPAKRFEIKLYKGTPASPVVFDKAGVVALGCNVHDWMLAYVLVVETPHFAKSGKDGVLRLTGLPAGTYELKAWYPGMREPALLQNVTLAAAESRSIDHHLQVNIKTQPKAMPFDPMRYSFNLGPRPISGADYCTSPRS